MYDILSILKKKKEKKKTMLSPYTKTNIVQGTVIYNKHFKFELNQKHGFDNSILLII